ncbi:hypothetical protein [Shewanella atlantica]|uniref:Uncharacterized protein n=1 Tax=Shewanella atlantica TaxID=271099 RepID=A0A3S0LEL0_9GAMM|nr:hypothetical protein [Shewanella atlantica]RTR33582.1 hypothetical protein EKG39_07630 [Shewanella atlantica]
MNNKFALASLLVLGLSACGSDSSSTDDGTTTPPSPPDLSPEMAEIWKHIDSPYHEFKETKLEGIVFGHIGYQQDHIMEYINKGAQLAHKTGDMSADLNGDGWINRWDAAKKTESALKVDSSSNAELKVDPGISTQTLASSIHQVLATNPDGLGAGTARPDIFVDGHLSAFDYLRYLVATRSDLRFEGEVTRPEESAFNTHEFKISWDKNGDGLFNEDDNTQYETNFNSDDWHYSYVPSFEHLVGTKSHNYVVGYTMYRRMDEHRLQDEMQARFYSTGPVLKTRRELTWQWEQDWLAKNDGKVVLKTLMRSSSDHPASIGLPDSNDPVDPAVYGRNLEIRAFNLRSDVYQPGVITGLDFYLSLMIDHELDMKLAYWPSTASNVKADSFIIQRIFDYKSAGFSGASTRYIVSETVDFSDNPNCMLMGLNGMPSTLAPWGGTEVPWLHAGGSIDECRRLFNSRQGNGGLNVNHDMSNAVINFGMDRMFLNYSTLNTPDLITDENYLGYMGYKHIYRSDYGGYDINTSCGNEPCTPVTLIEFDIATEEKPIGNAPILNETHFGWKLPDCALCHNEDKNPQGHGGQSWPVNAGAGFKEIQPYYCATCHGSNGAPQRHGYDTYCTQCHNPNNTDPDKYGINPKNHGEVSHLFLLEPEDNRVNQHTGTNFGTDDRGEVDYTQHIPHVTEKAPTNLSGEIELYPAFWVPHNNGYTLSKSFPDPYSCTTCHQAPE